MVAIVSGNSLGLDLTSLRTLGPQEFTGSAANGGNGEGVYVNVANGNLVVQGQDAYVTSVGADVAAVRTYNSLGLLNDDNGVAGDNWSNGYFLQPLKVTGIPKDAASTVQLTGRDGAVSKFTWDVPRGYYITTDGDGAHDSITVDTAGVLYTWTDGTTGAWRKYDAGNAFRLVSSGEPAGKVLTYSYDGTTGQLNKVLNSDLEGTRYEYVDGRLTKLLTVKGDVEVSRVTYEYNTGRLSKVTVDLSPGVTPEDLADVYWTEYGYEGDSKRVNSIRQNDGTQLTFKYDLVNGALRIGSVTNALNEQTKFNYALDGSRTTVTDPLGRNTVYETDTQGRLARITAPASGGVTPTRSFHYDGQGNVDSETDGAGRVVTHVYDEFGNAKLQTDSAGGRVERQFDKWNQLTVETTYLKADPDGAGAAQATEPVSSRQFWSATVRSQLLFELSAEGRVTQHQYDGSGQRIATIEYVGARYPVGAELTQSALEAWALGPVKADARRIKLDYDGRGNLQTRTTFGQVDANGAGVEGTQSIETMVWDQGGLLLKTVSHGGNVTSYSHDGLGRMETATNALGQISVTDYLDSQQKVVHRFPLDATGVGLVSTSFYDLAGREFKTVQSGGGMANLATHLYEYDAAGRLRVMTDPTGRKQWIVYTDAGYKAADIDANGTMKEYGYDASGRVAWTKLYDKAVDTAILNTATVTVDTLRATTTGVSHSTWHSYDAVGRLVRTAVTVRAGNEAAVTEWQYDGASRLVQEIRYATTVPVTAAGFTSVPLPGKLPDADRISRYFHDGDGLLRGTLDAEGYLTELRYDNAGQLVRRIAYATATPIASRASGTLAALIPAAHADDIRSDYLYDGHGRRVAELDGERYLTEHRYDVNGRLSSTLRYANSVGGGVTTLSAALPLAGAGQTETALTYDALGRVASQTNVEGTVTLFRYDVAGNLTATIRAAGTDEARSNVARYDLLGRVTAELSPENAARILDTMTQAQAEAIWVQYATVHTYDAAGRRKSTTDSLNRSTFFYYDEDGALRHTIDAIGRVRERVYDDRGRLTKEIERVQQISTLGLTGGDITPDLLSRLVVVPDDSAMISYKYSRDGLVTTLTSATGHDTTNVHNAFGEITSDTQQMGALRPDRVAQYGYDRRGLMVQTLRDPGGAEAIAALEKVEYDAFGRVASSLDAVGKTRTRTYDRLGRVVTTLDAVGAKRETSYDAFNRALTQTDAMGNVTRFFYNVSERGVTVTTPEGVSSTVFRTRHGEEARRFNGLGQKTEFSYNRDGRLVQTTTPVATDSTTYDKLGRVQSTKDANDHVVEYAYDDADRVKRRTVDPGGLNLITTYAYDGRDVRVTDPAGVVMLTRYDKKGRVATQVVDENGLKLTTTYSYNPVDQVLTVTNSIGTVTLYGYDELGRRKSEIVDYGGLNLKRLWTYDDAGNVLTSTDAAGSVTRYAYDAEGRLQFTVDPLQAVTQHGYDKNGNLVSRVQFATPLPAGAAVENVPTSAVDRKSWWIYDKDNRQVFEVDALKALNEQTYDTAGNVIRRTAYAKPLDSVPEVGLARTEADIRALITPSVELDRTVRFGYDAGGRLKFTMDATGALRETRYDAGGSVVTSTRYALPGSLLFGNSLSPIATTSAADQTERYEYDAVGRLVKTTDAFGLSEITKYDDVANTKTFTNKKGDTWTYFHDAAGRLIKERSPVTTVARIVDADLMTVASSDVQVVTTMTYDNVGNLVSRTEASGRPEERTTTYGYDAVGRQVLVALGSAQVYYAGDDPRANAMVGPSERPTTLQVQTVYDAVGNAVANIDVGGALSQKTYDSAGRVRYEVDARGFVTGYERNTFGEVTLLTRYATGTTLEALTVTRANQAVTTAGVEQVVKALGVDHSNDRTLSSTYDRAGRVTRVQEKAADVFDPTAAAASQWRSERKTTDTGYNAFGEAVEVKALRNVATGEGSVFTRFYDGNGREKASIDATGYVTEKTYDAFGNLVSLKEFANAVTTGWSKDSYTRGVASANDRKTEYEYDKGNRKVFERRLAVEYSMASDGTSVVGDLVTEYRYDAVGNQVTVIDANGRPTRTYYDALGRISAVVQPLASVLTPAGGDLPVAVNPLTTFLRDAHGNVLRELRHANGATVTAAGYTAGPASLLDRAVRTRYDRLGRAMQITDALDHHQFFSYDAYGKVAKKWQPLEDGSGRVTYEVNTYDSLGQLESVRRPGTTMQVQGGITARWITVPYQPEPSYAPPPGGELALGWTELEGARVSVEVTYTTPVYFITTGELTTETQPTTTRYDARTVTVTKEKSAAQAPAGMTVVFEDPVAKIGTIRVKELKGTTWETRWEGTYAQAQGTGVKEVDQSSVEQKVETLRYNAFGEVLAHLADGAPAEYFHYDAAGRLWRSNAGDGVDKIYLYDALGNRTSEIRSPGDAGGNVDLRLVASAEDAHADTRNRRTDFTYDAAARLVQKTDAARLEMQGGLAARQMVVTSAVVATTPGVYVDETETSGHYELGTSTVKLTWTNLTALGSGDVKVRVRYQAASTVELGAGGATVFDSEVFASHEAAQGVTLTWATKPISSITEITVWKKDSNGAWTEVIKQAPGTSTYQIDLQAASNRWSAEYLDYRLAGSTAQWVRAPLTDFGDRAVWAALAGLAAGTYEYKRGLTPQGLEERQIGTGSFTIASNRTVTVPTTDNGSSVWQRPVVYQKMDRWGNAVEISDPRVADWKTVYAYNANNQLVMQRLPTAGGTQATSNPSTRIYYDPLGRQVAVRDALGNVNGTAYGATGNLVREEHADTGVITHRYNAFGEKVATTDARGNVQTFTYDKRGNLLRVNKGTAAVYDVDVNQQVLAPVTRAIEERWTYDALGRKLAHFNGESEKTSYRYDLLGNVIEVVQPMGQRTYAAFDAQGHKIAEVDANGYEATWRYDYFGRLLAHTDIGGATYQYTYDNARQLLKQTNSRGQKLAYKYDAAGQVTEVIDTQEKYAVKVTTYAYDLSGRRLLEKTVAGAEVYQDNRLAYDAQGKLRDVADTRVRMQLAYDANGNRTSVSTTVRYAGLTGEVLDKATRFFQYDQMNRQTVVDALDAAGAKDRATHELTYDKNGNRTSDTYLAYAVIRNPASVGVADAWTVREVLAPVVETYAYDSLNRLTEIQRDTKVIDARGYDAADRVMTSGAFLSNAYIDQLQRLVLAGMAGRLDTRINRYDANGRMLHQSVKSADGKAMQEISWDPNWASLELNASQVNAYRAEGYDLAGNVKGYTVFTNEGSKTAKYSTTLARFEGYVGTDGSVTESTEGQTNRNEQVYDANGQLVQVIDNHLTGNERSFVNDAQGRALSTLRGGHVQRQLIVNGEVMGRYGVGVHDLVATDSDGYPNFRDIADFNFSFAAVSPTNPAPAPGTYIVQAGDTLQSIASGAYGDSALWYLIAQANGLSSNDDARVGQVLNVPNRVGSIHNNEGTFKPYDPSKMTGDLAPSMPTPGPNGCGAAAQILILVVAIVVTICTAGAAAMAMGAVATTTTACVASVSTIGTVMSTGVAALSGAYGAAIGVIAGGVGAAVGSAVSQGVAMAVGIQDHFSWTAVGQSALSGAITAGVGTYGAGSPGLLNGMEATAVIGRAVVGNVASQGIGVALGLQRRFDWRGVAAAAVGAGVGHAVGAALGPQTVDGVVQPTAFSGLGGMGGVLRGTLAGMASGAAAAAVRGGRVVMQQVAVDAFGNALGTSLATESSGAPTTPPAVASDDPLGDFITKNNNWAHVDVGPMPALVNGRTFLETVALQKATNDPRGLRAYAQDISGVIRSAQSLWGSQSAGINSRALSDTSTNAELLENQIYEDGFGDGLMPTGGNVRVTPGMVNGIAVNQRVNNAFQAAGDLAGIGDMYRDYRLLGGLMSELQQQGTIDRLKTALQDKMGMIRNLPTPEAMGAVPGIGSDGAARFNNADLIDRYTDALRKVELMKQGVIELDTRSMLITSIGTGRLSPAEWVAENTRRYANAFGTGLDEGQRRYDAGTLRFPQDMPSQLQVGSFADNAARGAVIAYNRSIGVPEGPGQLLSMNRWSYDPSGSGAYNRIDLLMDLGPSRNNGALILRTGIEGKSTLAAVQSSSAQLQRVYEWNTPNIITVTRQGALPWAPPKRLR